MRKLSLVAAALAAAIVAAVSLSSSHREAPGIMLDPAADNTDLYAWTAPDAPGALTVAANWIPGQNPANGPNFFRWDPRAHYYVNFDNTGDGKWDVRYLFRFRTRVKNENSFLYAGPNTTSYDQLNVSETYNVTRQTATRRRGRARVRSRTVGRGLPVAPPNIGPKTFPNYQALADGAVRGLDDGTNVFVGQRDDPFFVDLGGAFDAINVRKGTGNEGGGKDDFSGMSISSIVMQLPERLVTRDGRAVDSPDSGNSVVGVWSTTERRRLQVTNEATISQRGRARRARSRFVQVSRLGNPLVNEVVIPLGQKDRFNRTTPDRDAALYGRYVVEPELAAILNALFNVGAPTEDRTDIVQALLQGLPNLNQHKGIEGPPAVDTLKINLGVPPAQGAPDRFGVIGGDLAGFPNGRRLEDDVVDIELQVVAGLLKGNAVPLGDGVDQNDKPFLASFPYLAPPTAGFDSDPSNRIEPNHPPVPAGG
jgi:hypothetical protein